MIMMEYQSKEKKEKQECAHPFSLILSYSWLRNVTNEGSLMEKGFGQSLFSESSQQRNRSDSNEGEIKYQGGTFQRVNSFMLPHNLKKR